MLPGRHRAVSGLSGFALHDCVINSYREETGFFILFKHQLRQSLHNLHALHTHIDDAQHQVTDVAGVADLFGPVVVVIDYGTWVRKQLFF
jgi:hypothetical protein